MSPIVCKLLDTNQKLNNVFLSDKCKIYTFLNPVSYLDALHNKELFSQFDGIFADGGLLVKTIKIVYGKNITRRSFDMTSIAPGLFGYAVENKMSIAIVATKQKSLEKAVEIIQTRYPGTNISYCRDGYFSGEEEMDKEAQKITDINPDFLIVGMGIVKQEEFLLKVKLAGYQGIGFTCGGFIHQTAQNKVDYYPKWINNCGLRFVYRMYKEPYTRKRYMKAAFVFPVRFIWEKIFS